MSEATSQQAMEDLLARGGFDETLLQNFPQMALAMQRNQIDRRTFLKIAGASLALAGIGLSGCAPVAPPDGKILPYASLPENVIPGKPDYFASAMVLGGYATGLLIKANEGRPTRIEGNPRHPASLGGSDLFTQASILDMYNPARSTRVLRQNTGTTWEDFLAALDAEIAKAGQGAGLRILTETVTSPTFASQAAALLQQYPSAKWVQYEPVSQDNVLAGAQLAFGVAVNTVYSFDKAKVVVALDADFLTAMPGSLRYARDFATSRKVRAGSSPATMSRLYAVESTPSLVGASADHRVPMKASQVETFARALAAALGVAGITAPSSPVVPQPWLEAVVADLKANTGAGLVVAGNQQSPAVHALAHAINAQLNNVGTTVRYIAPAVANVADQTTQFAELVKEMDAGSVTALIILGGNPAYTAPADLAFGAALAKVPFSVHLSLYADETSALTTWHVPQTHFIEEWSDARAFDGTATIIQPPVRPLYEAAKSAHELMALLVKDSKPPYEILRAFWQTQNLGADFEAAWRLALRNGSVEGAVIPPAQVTLSADLAAKVNALPAADSQGLELIFRPDPTLWDGRFAMNAWLQELPEPITHLSWDNAALVSQATATKLGVSKDSVVELTVNGRTMRAPILIVPTHADDCVTISLGYGRGLSAEGEAGLSFNAYAIRTSTAPWFTGGLEVRSRNETYPLATIRTSMKPGEFDAVRSGTLKEFNENPAFANEKGKKDASLLSPYPYDNNKWGMTIDLSACIGCNACVLACQTENSTPTVGKKAVSNSREMYWLRVDSYNTESAGTTAFQPVPCMHCETAPCEQVCPVQATVHSSEGLNQMVYSRCVGTRYCSANCPYSVRRFNFLDVVDKRPILEEIRNPEVTVRAEGVMEKCTFCVQRISAARIAAKKENRPIQDGEVMPACMAACPTKAIIFGNLNDASAEVTNAQQQPHNYGLLAELNTKPRTTYLARLQNPNEALDGSKA
jgi:molybdopterin-containing oxidoreductase family iron-sulfur binding subunit